MTNRVLHFRPGTTDAKLVDIAKRLHPMFVAHFHTLELAFERTMKKTDYQEECQHGPCEQLSNLSSDAFAHRWWRLGFYRPQSARRWLQEVPGIQNALLQEAHELLTEIEKE